jgi:hypothetical protein
MASTRNLNTPGDYALEQSTYTQQFAHTLYEHSSNGQAYTRNFPGNGLLPGGLSRNDLATNSCDIESELFGIGSTNLVQPLAKVEPKLIPLQSLNLYQKPVLYIPKDLFIEPNQRDLGIN